MISHDDFELGCKAFAAAWASDSGRTERWQLREPPSALHRPGQVLCRRQHEQYGCICAHVACMPCCCTPKRLRQLLHRTTQSHLYVCQGPRFISLEDVPVQLVAPPVLPPAAAPFGSSGANGADHTPLCDCVPLGEDGDMALLPTVSAASVDSTQRSPCTTTVLCEYHLVYHPSYRVPVLCMLPRHQGAAGGLAVSAVARLKLESYTFAVHDQRYECGNAHRFACRCLQTVRSRPGCCCRWQTPHVERDDWMHCPRHAEGHARPGWLGRHH